MSNPRTGEGARPGLAYGQCRLRRRTSTRWGLVAALAAVAALAVSPGATPASYTIDPDGAAVTVAVSNAGGTSTASFTGTAGHRISLRISSVTITSSKVSILKPGGTLVAPFTVTKGGYFLEPVSLPTTGTYKIVVDPKYDYTGRMTLQLYDVPIDSTVPITANGPAVTVATTKPGENARLTFTGTADEWASVSVGATDTPFKKATLKLREPDGTLLASRALGAAGGFLDAVKLPATGLYTLVVDPTLWYTGSGTVQLYTFASHQTGSISPCAAMPCTSTQAATAVPGQNASLAFTTASAGKRVSLLLSNSTYEAAKVTVLKDGAPLFAPVLVNGLDTFVDTTTLATAGEYTVFVDPQTASVGSVDVTLYDVPANQTGAIPTNGSAVTASTSMPGQNSVFTFSGSKGQRVSLEAVAGTSTYDSVKVSIVNPDGTLLFSPALAVMGGLGAFQEPVALPATSTGYKVKVDPQGAGTGQVDLKLYTVPPNVTGTLSPSVAKTVSITGAGQNAVLTYAGTAGQRISLNLTGVTLGGSSCCSARIKVTKPDGSTLVSSTSFGTDGKFIDSSPLGTTGTYKVSIDPEGAAVGNVTVTLYVVTNDVSATSPALTSGGVAASVTISNPGQNGRIAFTGPASGRFAFKLVSFSPQFCDVKISVLRPDGTSLTTSTCSVDGDWFDTKGVTPGAAYKILVDPQGVLTGTASFTLYAPPADINLPLSGSASPTLSPGQNARYTFTGAAGKTASISLSSGTISSAWARLYNTNGTSQLDSKFWDPTITNDPVQAVLPTTTPPGAYTFLLDPVGDASGSMTFALTVS